MEPDEAVVIIYHGNLIKRLEEFRKYSHELEIKFENDVNNLADKFGLTNSSINDKSSLILNILFSREYRTIQDIFIGTYRKSTLVSIYSFLENTMRSLCEYIYEVNEYPIKLDDLKGDGIQRSKEYLEKMAKIKFDSINSSWSNLQNLNALRNCIVHTEGDIKNFKRSQKLKNIVENNDYLSLERDRDIVIEREFIDETINEVEKLIDYLFFKIFNYQRI